MEAIIAVLIALAGVAAIAILGRIGQAHAQEEERLLHLQQYYHCDRKSAVELLKLMRKAKIHHVLKQSGLTL